MGTPLPSAAARNRCSSAGSAATSRRSRSPKPVQIHTGFGDRDLRLVAADPALLQRFLAAAEGSGVPIVLLHCYPYHRQAGWLAQVFPNVYVDIGLTMSHVGAGAGAVLAELME